MNNDIKEILDNFKDYELRYKQYNENQFIIFYRDIHLLLDYITNLQQELEIMVKDDERSQETIIKLSKENERLKEKSINEVLRNDFDMCVKDLKKANKKIEKLEKYKSRNEKATEYLKSKEDSLFMTFSDDMLDHDELIDKKIGTTLLNILNGKE